MDERQVKAEYGRNLDRYKRLCEEAQYVLRAELAQRGIKIHEISGRVKDIDSLVEKCGRKGYVSPFDEAPDIVGVRVVCLFLSDVQRIAEVVRNSFEVVDLEDKIQGADVVAFGYMSAHFTVKMRRQYAGPRYQDLGDLRVEVQIRTIAMHAWALVSHYLDYKTATDLPRDLRRDFYALSGLFYIADSHFEVFYGASQRSRDRAARSFASNEPSGGQVLDFDVLTAYLDNAFPDRGQADAASLSQLLSDLNGQGITTVGDLRNLLSRTADAFAAYETDHPPGDAPRFNRVGAVRISLQIADPDYERKTAGSSGLARRYQKLMKSAATG